MKLEPRFCYASCCRFVALRVLPVSRAATTTRPQSLQEGRFGCTTSTGGATCEDGDGSLHRRGARVAGERGRDDLCQEDGKRLPKHVRCGQGSLISWNVRGATHEDLGIVDADPAALGSTDTGAVDPRPSGIPGVRDGAILTSSPRSVSVALESLRSIRMRSSAHSARTSDGGIAAQCTTPWRRRALL